MEKKFTPTVITSRKARKEIERIKGRHAELVRAMQNQALKVSAWKEQKRGEQAQARQEQAERAKIKMEQESKSRAEAMTHERDRMTHAQKMGELELKRRVLSKE